MATLVAGFTPKSTMGKARCQRSHSALYRGFRLVTSTFVLSTLDVYLYSYIPQALLFFILF